MSQPSMVVHQILVAVLQQIGQGIVNLFHGIGGLRRLDGLHQDVAGIIGLLPEHLPHKVGDTHTIGLQEIETVGAGTLMLGQG